MAAPIDTQERTDQLAAPSVGLAEHSHVGGRTVRPAAVESHLHGIGSLNVADHPVPTGKEETWRFTPLRRLRGLHADAEFEPGTTEYSWTDPQGAVIRRIEAADPAGAADLAAIRAASDYLPIDRTTARILDPGQTSTTLVVDVPADTTVADPVVVSLQGAGGAAAAASAEAGHIVIRVGDRSSADVVLIHEGSATIAHLVEVIAGDGSQVRVASVQEWAPDTVHLAHHHLKIGRDATVKHTVLTFGGDLVRISATADYAGPGGDLELLGLYFADAGQHLEHRIFVDHAVPHGKSRALYKGALQGESAHTVWIGDVLIRNAALGTDTYELNRNLVLTEGARADSVPNLEIETGEIVGAGHASATGRFDDDQLFYLLSRGIPSDVARRLVVRGFFGEVLHKIGIPLVVERATQTIERELAISGS